MPSRCCHGFVLPDTLSFESARWQFVNKLRRLRELQNLGLLRDRRERVTEDLRTLQFLVPISIHTISPQLLTSVLPGTLNSLEQGEVIWTCKYFQDDTGRCGIYENRPSMCKTFPDNDTAGLENGHNALCHRCSSSYCKYHPEFV